MPWPAPLFHAERQSSTGITTRRFFGGKGWHIPSEPTTFRAKQHPRPFHDWKSRRCSAGPGIDQIPITLRHDRSLRSLRVQIFVRDNNVDQAMKVLKKKMQREGIFRELKRKRYYEKPSEERARQKGEAVRRARKLARKQAQREGLIAAPKKRVPVRRTGGF
jgi:small subunit ribosomal protein S21